jgi:hypothetical protein
MRVGGARVVDQWTTGTEGTQTGYAERWLQGDPCGRVRWLAVGIVGRECEVELRPGSGQRGRDHGTIAGRLVGVCGCQLWSDRLISRFDCDGRTPLNACGEAAPPSSTRGTPRWSEAVTTAIRLAADTDAYVVDVIELR